MKSSNQHIVLRQTLELEVDQASISDQHALMERLSVLGQIQVPYLLDAGVNDWLPASEYRRIEQLTLTVEVDRLENLESALQQQFPQAFKKALEQHLMPGTTSDSASIIISGPIDWLFHFLKTGTLPWSAPQTVQPGKWQEELQGLLWKNSRLAQQLLALLLAEPGALYRLLTHFGTDILWLIIELFQPKLSKRELAKLQNSYQPLSSKSEVLQIEFWQQALRKIKIEEGGFLLSQTSKKLNETQDTSETPLFVEGAGLILLHPFLPALLRQMGWADDNQVLYPAEAAALLYSLHTGGNPSGEWQLVLPKILLGLPLHGVLELASVTEEQMAVGEEMIQAAIQHWKVLGNTSIAGFRESFLQRPGRLHRMENGWQLTLEQRPYDMLMDQLPWQVNYIRLPWMEEVVKVGEW